MSSAEHVMDYTRHAAPLDLETIRRDANYRYRDSLQGVDRFVVWQHQFDWLVKQFADYKITKRKPFQYFEVHDISPSEVPCETVDAVSRGRGGGGLVKAELFGIDVEIINPDKEWT